MSAPPKKEEGGITSLFYLNSKYSFTTIDPIFIAIYWNDLICKSTKNEKKMSKWTPILFSTISKTQISYIVF